MNSIAFKDFKKSDIRVGKILEAEFIEGSDKLLRLKVDVGEETRQIVAGIRQFYSPENLIGKTIPIIVNLEPRVIKGVESKGMLLAADKNGEPVLLTPDKEVPTGSIIK